MVGSIVLGKVTNCMVGISGVDVASRFKFFRWRGNAGRVTPATVANTVHPIAWNRGHEWYELQLGLLSEARDAFSSCIFYGSGTGALSSGIVVKVTDSSGTTKTTTAHVVEPDHVESGVEDYGETITIYHLKANWVDPFA